MLKETVLSFIDDEVLSRGAAIAFYTVTSIAPVLLIVIAIAGLVFGRDAAQNAISNQFSGLMGRQTADVLQSAVASAADKSSSIIATIIGITTLIATASGVFGEMQAALNSIWKAKPQATTVSRLIRARILSLGLVATLGFLLIVSLVISAGLTAFGNYLDTVLPMGKLILPGLNFVVSVVLLGVLFGAIYKVLPDRSLQWNDVIVGAVITSVLFNIGKSLIAWYIGSSAIASSYGAAGGLIVLFWWVYYSVQIFLFGAEFTKIYANRHGSKQRKFSYLVEHLIPLFGKRKADFETDDRFNLAIMSAIGTKQTIRPCLCLSAIGPKRTFDSDKSMSGFGRKSGHRRECPLLGVKRTWRLRCEMSASDPKRTSATRLASMACAGHYGI
jgi:membrane protein